MAIDLWAEVFLNQGGKKQRTVDLCDVSSAKKTKPMTLPLPSSTPILLINSDPRSIVLDLNPNFHSFSLLESRKWTELTGIKQLHAQLIVTGLICHNPTLNKFISHSLSIGADGLSYACTVFTHTRQPNTVIWNAILRGYVNHNMPRKALSSYVEMLEGSTNVPDRFSFPSLLKGCTHLLEFKLGRALHGQVIKLVLDSDLYTGTTLLNMYSACGDIYSSRMLFENMGRRNKVVWTSMISGYVKNNQPHQALLLFEKMEEEGLSPDEVTMTSIVSACAESQDIKIGRRMRNRIEEMGIKICAVLGSALVDMYAKCGDLESAQEVFDKLCERDVYAWSAMINGYVKNDRSKEALELFRVMVGGSTVRPNEVTILASLSACAQLGDLESGRWVHAYIDKVQEVHSMNLENSLIDMYSKCGEIDVARELFKGMSKRDIVSWNVMITGLALHGLGMEALVEFNAMQSSGLKPDDITFIGVLSACSHAGLIQEGRQHFHNMEAIYGIRPKLEHYGCMVDILCRTGLLEEAREFIREMPVDPNGAIWGSMLGACRVFNNIEYGEEGAKHLLKLEPRNDGVYVLLSNIYAKRQMWDKVREVRELMNERGIQKTPGCSSIVIDGVVHSFLTADRSHPDSTEIHSMLSQVIDKLKLAGYIADTSEVLLNVDQGKKEESVLEHSEKLALSYGLLKLRKGARILILKNLRVCSDCHSALKHVSKIYNREITVRDRSRFHVSKTVHVLAGIIGDTNLMWV